MRVFLSVQDKISVMHTESSSDSAANYPLPTLLKTPLSIFSVALVAHLISLVNSWQRKLMILVSLLLN